MHIHTHPENNNNKNNNNNNNNNNFNNYAYATWYCNVCHDANNGATTSATITGVLGATLLATLL